MSHRTSPFSNVKVAGIPAKVLTSIAVFVVLGVLATIASMALYTEGAAAVLPIMLGVAVLGIVVAFIMALNRIARGVENLVDAVLDSPTATYVYDNPDADK